MASSLWKYIKAKVAGQPDQTSINDLLAFSKGAQHGFPECPVALAFDKQLSLLAIATGLGSVHIYGSSGVALVYHDEKQRAVRHVAFISNQGRLVVVQEDGHISLLELNASKDGTFTLLENVRNIQSSRVEKVSCAAVVTRDTASFLWCGCEDSSIAVFSLPLLEDNVDSSLKSWLTTEASKISGTTAVDGSQEVEKTTEVIVTEEKTPASPASHGKVVSIEQHPDNQNLLLVGFADGQIVLYDLEAKMIQRRFDHSGQTMTSVGWQSSGDAFNSTYDDGSYLAWNIAQEAPLSKPVIPYGPFPCLPVGKMVVHSSSGSEGPVTIFSGGLPREKRFNDHHSVTVQHGEKHTALDFPSAVVDFVLLDDGALAVPSDAHTLVVLLENQLVAIDLTSDKYPEIVAPYLTHIHAPITSFELYQDVSAEVMNGLREVGKKPSDIRPFGGYSPKYSHRQWPIHGGSVVPAVVSSADEMTAESALMQNTLLVTAHGDGCLRFWEVLPGGFRLLHKLDAATRYFHVDQETEFADDSSDVWPPFRKYGFEQETVQEPRMKVEKFSFDVASQTLVIGGQAGQVLLYKFNPSYAVVHFETINVSLVGEELQYVWRGTQPLVPRGGNLEMFAGFQAVLSVQMDPPSAITALAVQPEWNLLAVGTGHGFALLDYSHRTRVLINCTLKPDGENTEVEMTGSGTLQQKAKRAGETLRRSLRRIPRPHLNMRSPTSYTVNGGVSENGTAETKKNTTASGDVELLEGRLVATSPVGDNIVVTNGHQEVSHGEVMSHTVVTDKVEFTDENGNVKTVEQTMVVESTTPDQKFLAVVENVQAMTAAAIAEPVSLNGYAENGGPLIVDEQLMQALEADVMPPGLEEELKHAVEEAKVERTYNYEATTVRTLLLTTCAIHPTQSSTVAAKTTQPCLWAGLNNGTIYSYALTVPEASTTSSSDQITAVAAKEIHLRHGAPVIFMAVVDHSKMKAQTESTRSIPSSPLPPASPTSLPQSPLTEDVIVASPSSTSNVGGGGRPNWKDTDKSTQKLLVASEEQIKMFNLPSLKAYGKYKLSNGRFRKVDLMQVGPSKDEYCVVATTNRGEVEVITLPGLKRRQRGTLNKKEDVSAAFSRHGQGVFLSGSHELQRFALIHGTDHQLPACLIQLPEGARPAPPLPVEPSQTLVEATAALQEPLTPLPTLRVEDSSMIMEEKIEEEEQVENVELQDNIQQPVIVLQETVLVPVVENGQGDGEEGKPEVVVVVGGVPEELEMDEKVKHVLVEEQVVIKMLDDSLVSENQLALADISSDSIIDHFHSDLKNGNMEEESGMMMNGVKDEEVDGDGQFGSIKVHSLEEKLKAMEMDAQWSGTDDMKGSSSYSHTETTTTH